MFKKSFRITLIIQYVASALFILLGVILLVLSGIKTDDNQSLGMFILGFIGVVAICFGGYFLFLSHREYKYFIKNGEVLNRQTLYRSAILGVFLIVIYFVYSPLSANWFSLLPLLLFGIFVSVKVFIYHKYEKLELNQ